MESPAKERSIMTKMLSIATLLLCLTVSPVLAHHPAEDMVDEEVYAMIDALVADTPHADMVFDDEMGQMTTIITVDSVGATDVLIMDGLLDATSLLDGEVEIYISFPEPEETLLRSLSDRTSGSSSGSYYDKKWSEWGRPVEITIIQKY